MKLSETEWQAASGLLDEALELPAAARLAWVESLSEERSALKPLLRELLGRQELLETNEFLGGAPPVEGFSSLVGTTIGAYRLVRELGRGGMGTVWLAERADGLIRRPVALKLPHPTLYDSHFAERFARERDILASLNHRSIARLYDAGISAAGQPFLALEYVQGTPFTEYCDRRTLSIDDRIGLFREILHAVDYAHRLRVIHRDLKPSNILITSSGEVRLLDFGIAKLITDGAGGSETELTRVGGRALTMDYAAPEQLARQAVSPQSDVYSLGIILYELLTGSRPYQLKRQSLGALEEAILDQEPARPSARDIPDIEARARGVGSARLRSRLRGDLDTIVLKALRKRPSERYGSVESFALDLQRYLRGQPVEARADSGLYRLGKFAARNRLIVGAACLAIAALIVGAALSLWQAQVARAQAVAALQEAKRAQVVQDFLLDIFRANSNLQSDPQKARQTTARELLDTGARRVGEDLKDVPAAAEQALLTLSDMYEQLGLEPEAAALQLQRINAVKQAYGPRDTRVASALSRYAKALANTPERGRINAVLDEAKEILDDAHDESSSVRADLLIDYASLFRYSSPGMSRRYADDDIALLDKYHPASDELLLALLFAARARTALGRYPAAIVLYQRDLVENARQIGTGTAWDVAPLAQLAGAQVELLLFADAERNFRASLALSERLNGKTHNETLQTQIRFAAYLSATGRRPEGRKLMQDAWDVFRADPGKKENSVGSIMYGFYAQSLLDAGDLAAAAPLISQEIEAVRGLYPESTLLSQALLRRAALRIELGQYDAAQADVTQALAGWQHVAGTDADPALENPYLLALARIAIARGQADDADQLLRRLHRPAYAGSLPVDLDQIRGQILFARTDLSAARNAEAMASARMALETIESSPIRRYLERLEAEAAWTLAVAERRNRLPSAARKHLEQALELLRGNDDANSLPIARAELTLATCLSDLGERQSAGQLRERADRSVATHRELSPEAARFTQESSQ